MSGKVEEKLQEQTATTAFQLIWGVLKGAGRFIADQESIQRGMARYAANFLERHGQIKVLSMTEPVPLREIYVAARVVPPAFLSNFSTIDKLQELFLQQARRSLFLAHRIAPKRPALELANEKQFLNVLGAPGAGKSTFLRRLGLEALLPRNAVGHSASTLLGLKAGLDDNEFSQYAHSCLPVLIELRRIRADEIDLVRFIQNELALCGLPESERLVETLLKSGRLLILLDGLDEVPSSKLDGAIEHIRDFVDRYRDNRFVTSCRTAFYRNYFQRFTDVVLADFDDDQIASFVRNWFRSPEDRQCGTAEEFLQLLDDSSNASARELASTPLLLTFLCLAYDGHQRLPPNRSELYRQALDILLEKWAASKRVHNDPIYRELHAKLEVQMLAEIAARAFQDGRYFFSRRELTNSIADFLRGELNAPKNLNSDQVLDAIEIQQGLIVQRAKDAWSFSHLTLQEYLTAVWYEDNQKVDALVDEWLFDKRWREVFVLVAGVVNKADDMLLRMLKVAEAALVSAPQGARLLQWARESAVYVGDAQRTAARRVFALDLMLTLDRALDRPQSFDIVLTFDRSLDRARPLDPTLELTLDHALDRARPPHNGDMIDRGLQLLQALDLSHILVGDWIEAARQLEVMRTRVAETSSREGLQSALMRVQDVVASAMRLPPDLRKINARNRKVLENYLDVFQLIVDCRNAATRVGRSAWDELCRRMCAPSA